MGTVGTLMSWGLVKMQILITWLWEGASDFVFLRSSQVPTDAASPQPTLSSEMLGLVFNPGMPSSCPPWRLSMCWGMGLGR